MPFRVCVYCCITRLRVCILYEGRDTKTREGRDVRVERSIVFRTTPVFVVSRSVRRSNFNGALVSFVFLSDSYLFR